MAKRRPVPVAGDVRTVTLALTADETTLERLAAMLLFSTTAPNQIEPQDWTEDDENIEPVTDEEAEGVRGVVRELLHGYAERHGLALAKALLAESGATGVGTATREELAYLRHHLNKWRSYGDSKKADGR